MKRDIEATNCGNQDHQGGDDVDMQTRGALQWLNPAAQSNNAVPPLFRTLAGSILSGVGVTVPLFTEDQLNGILKTLKAVYGGKKTYQLIGGNNVVDTVDHFSRIDAYQGRYKVLEDADTNEVTMMVNVFDSSFGRVEIMSNDFMNVDTNGNPDPNAAIIINPDLWHMDLFDSLHSMDLPDLGGGPSGFAKVMWALMCDSPRGNGKIYNT